MRNTEAIMTAKKERVPETVEFLEKQGFSLEELKKQQGRILKLELEVVKDRFNNLLNLFPKEYQADARKSLAKQVHLLWQNKETIKDNFRAIIDLFPSESQGYAKKSLSKQVQLGVEEGDY